MGKELQQLYQLDSNSLQDNLQLLQVHLFQQDIENLKYNQQLLHYQYSIHYSWYMNILFLLDI